MHDAPPFRKLLIANRGEIALRVVRACRELGIVPVAIFSEADRHALHVQAAAEAYCVGPAASAESYLRADRIIEVAKAAGVDAIHPGYGFLSENPTFARAVSESGMAFVGPPPSAMEAMGDKVTARRAMLAAGVPVVPGTTDPIRDPADALAAAREVGVPLMVKASAGGGGKGMRRVDRIEDLPGAIRAAQSEARNSFGDDRVYIEKFIENPRHVEVQILSDSHGNHLHLFERDCSVQRRNQKLIEEAPCPVLDEATRRRMTAVAVRAAAAVDYVGAGTVEFLLAPDGGFYFLEMNTRLQVEHPVTEMITGIDLVHAQIRVAAGRPLGFSQADIRPRGHAIEVRICAEDPENDFRPSPGTVDAFRAPEGPWVRFDGALHPGYEVPIHYDPMVGKLIVWGEDRAAAVGRMERALRELTLTGLRSNIGFFLAVMGHEPFRAGTYDTGYIARYWGSELGLPTGDDQEVAIVCAAISATLAEEAAARRTQAPSGATHGWKLAGRLRTLRRA
jgi:acetyl-CoA carboxylase biotin carboxylase subunit